MSKIPATEFSWILQERCRESHRIRQENVGNPWEMKAVIRPEIVRIFPIGSGYFPSYIFDLGS
jgi:hypothetical protein